MSLKKLRYNTDRKHREIGESLNEATDLLLKKDSATPLTDLQKVRELIQQAEGQQSTLPREEYDDE